jgi:hypothetical protein
MSHRQVLPLDSHAVLPIYEPLDMTYHGAYSVERQQTCHLPMLRNLLPLPNKTGGDKVSNPTLILCAGAMGVGKSNVAKQLFREEEDTASSKWGALVWNDPDTIKNLLPEAAAYAAEDPITAGTRLHRESCFISERLFWHTLHRGNSMILQGTLSDATWHAQLIGRVNAVYPHYRIVILHVTAPHNQVVKREHKRCLVTKRCIPPEILIRGAERSVLTVAALHTLVDGVAHVDNSLDQPLSPAAVTRALEQLGMTSL